MKRIIAGIVLLICLLSMTGLAACSKTNIITVGEETLTLPPKTKKINFSLPQSVECPYSANGTEYDLYTATLEELKILSQNSWETKYPDLADKQIVAEIAAAIFADLYPEKEIVYDGVNITIKINPVAKCIICRAEGNDGGFATLAINRKSGEIVMIAYGE